MKLNLFVHHHSCCSFGMLMSEMCTRDHPFSEVLLEKTDIIDLIKGKNNEAALKVP